MKTSVLLVIAFVVSAHASAQTGVGTQPLTAEAYEAVASFFQYDKTIPLDAHILATSETPAYTREKIVFTGGRGDRVPGILAIPKSGRMPYPVVLELHGGGSTKDGWWADDSFEQGRRLTQSLLSAGVAVLALDAQYHGERSANNDFVSLREMYFERKWYAQYRDMLVESTKDYLRALDYLATRPQVDATRVGVVGHSMGGLMSVYLTALEPRVRATVACVTALSNPWFYPLTSLNFAAAIRNRPVLVLAGRQDQLIPVESTERFVDLIGHSSELVLFDSGHRLPNEYIDRTLRWLTGHLR
jgi:dipeptidyl aminopeptidase/acylaminoacyl peptidase